MQHAKDGQDGWARRFLRGCCVAGLLLLLMAPWLAQEPAPPPGDAPFPGSAAPRVATAGPLTADARYITPAGRAAFALEALLARRIESMAPGAVRGFGPDMTADDFRRLYQGDGADFADLVLGPR